MSQRYNLSADQVKALYADGLTYSEIALKLHLTRSAVAGLIFRMKLSPRTRPGRGPDKKERKPRELARRMPAPDPVVVVETSTYHRSTPRKPTKPLTRNQLREELHQAILNTALLETH